MDENILDTPAWFAYIGALSMEMCFGWLQFDQSSSICLQKPRTEHKAPEKADHTEWSKSSLVVRVIIRPCTNDVGK